MTSDNLLKFLGNREYLHQVSYQELKSLVVQYPYSLSLRYLLAMKSQQEDNQDVDRNLELLATYGIDRAHLFNIYNKGTEDFVELEQSVLMQEDYLELKELSILERTFNENLDSTIANDLTFVGGESPTFIEPNEPKPDIKSTQIPKEASTEKEEEYYEINFDAENAKTREKDTPPIIEAEPKNLVNDKVETFEENDLPLDAVEINDYTSDKEKDFQEIENLFEETENEIIKEEAVSDSKSYIEKPEEVLEGESKTGIITEKEEITAIEPEVIPSEIPFEILLSETNPSLIEEKDSITVQQGEIEVEEEESLNTEEPVTEINQEEEDGLTTGFNFENLDKLEINLKEKEESFEVNPLIKLKPPSSKKVFSSWQDQFNPVPQFSGVNLLPVPVGSYKNEKKSQKVEKKIKGKYKKTVAFAEKSLILGKNIASETLAQLLVEQGHYKKASLMYEDLCLIMPEKTLFFAVEIEKIKDLK